MRDAAHNLFYVPPGNIHGSALTIDGAAFHHIVQVLRRTRNEELMVTDGAGSCYRCRIASTAKNKLRLEVIETQAAGPRPESVLEVAFVPLKGTRNDPVIEKGTELGVSAFFPFLSRHAVNRDLGKAKLDRFQALAVSAMLQSRRLHLPRITGIPDPEALAGIFSGYDLVLVADDKGQSEIPGSAKSILFVTGPEGGFDGREIGVMQQAGARLVSLGPHRLRAETAVLAGIVKILTAYKRL